MQMNVHYFLLLPPSPPSSLVNYLGGRSRVEVVSLMDHIKGHSSKGTIYIHTHRSTPCNQLVKSQINWCILIPETYTTSSLTLQLLNNTYAVLLYAHIYVLEGQKSNERVRGIRKGYGEIGERTCQAIPSRVHLMDETETCHKKERLNIKGNKLVQLLPTSTILYTQSALPSHISHTFTCYKSYMDGYKQETNFPLYAL